MKENKNKSNLDFRIMSFFFKIRDKFKPPVEKIRTANIKTGDTILDYGCIFAADIHPLGLIKVRKKAEKKGFNNIETIQTECTTGLNDESIDVVICFDVIHGTANRNDILKEFYRALKPKSILSFDDHHMKEDEIINFITSEGLFELSEKKDSQYNFIKI
jgi:ubiquinone/menaquinone biosynthesis C-methylase UbiE